MQIKTMNGTDTIFGIFFILRHSVTPLSAALGSNRAHTVLLEEGGALLCVLMCLLVVSVKPH